MKDFAHRVNEADIRQLISNVGRGLIAIHGHELGCLDIRLGQRFGAFDYVVGLLGGSAVAGGRGGGCIGRGLDGG